MDFERVAYFSQKRLELVRDMEEAGPSREPTSDDPYERTVEVAKRISSLPGYQPGNGMNSFGESYYTNGKWEHIFEADDTHELPLQLHLSVEYYHEDSDSIPEIKALFATWHDNLNPDNMSRKPISHEWVSVPGFMDKDESEAIQTLDIDELNRMLGLIEESVSEAETVSEAS